jgi:hypothetical protein
LRRVHQVVDWTGSTGTKPVTGLYVGATGLVANIADAKDIRGGVGPQGPQGAAIIQVTDKILNVGGWSLVGELYEQSISDASITATSVVDVVPNNADYATVSTAVFLPRTDSSTEAVKVYCRNLPTSTITVTINILN